MFVHGTFRCFRRLFSFFYLYTLLKDIYSFIYQSIFVFRYFVITFNNRPPNAISTSINT